MTATYVGSRDVTTSEGSRDTRTVAQLAISRGTPGLQVLQTG